MLQNVILAFFTFAALLAVEPAFAANSGPARDVRNVISAGQRQTDSACNSKLAGKPCVEFHDVSIVKSFAILSRVDSWNQQELYHLVNNHRQRRAYSGGDAFDASELVQHGVPNVIARLLVEQNAQSRRSAEPIVPEQHCIHTAVRSVSTYFKGSPGSGWVIEFFGRIYDPYQGTLSPALVDRGVPDLHLVRYGDRVQLCLTDAPAPAPHGCRPTFDPRGRVYRMYDYRLRRAYTSWNANHGCGGA